MATKTLTLAEKAAIKKLQQPTKRQKAVGAKLSKAAKEELANKIAKKPPPKRPKASEVPKELRFQGVTPEILEIFLERLASGESTAHICADPAMPPYAILNRWRQVDQAFGVAYDQALRIRAGVYAESIVADAEAALGLSSEGVAAKRLLVDAKKWVAEKLMPETYGNKVIHAGDKENPVQVAMVSDAAALVAKFKGVAK